jgi:4-amino-4-deoxy-L-arabinose transferase-like glycosyltransferase
MKRIFESIGNNPGFLPVFALLMLPFALFVNLGLMPLISDEPTRAIVTLEMILSGNYITPTINGEFYYNKPPLFNWILAGFVQASGQLNEFIFRLPTVLSLILMGLIIYLFSKKALGKVNALLAGLMLITSARILFWDSFQGLIDITYSLVTFCSFTALYYFSRRRNWLAMFVVTYALAATGYLMKGLPSIAFQGISLIAWLLFEKSVKKLFSWQHLAGVAIFLLITGSYYFAYLQTNSLQDVFSTLFDQSNRLNDKEGTMLSWALHMIFFPLGMGYEFAPWTLLLILLFDKDIRQVTFRDKFSVFCLIIFASNIVIYWVSADMRPRYLFMLFPLLFLIGIKAYVTAETISPKIFRLVNLVFRILSFAGAFSLLIYIFWNETNQMAGLWLVIPVLFFIALSASVLTIKIPRQSLVLLIIVMLSVRIGFNAFNLPARYNSYPDIGYREGEIIAGQLSKGHEVFILGDTPFNHDASFYISRESGQIITRMWGISNNQACYITDEINLAKFASKDTGFEVIHEFTIKLKETRLFLIKKPL